MTVLILMIPISLMLGLGFVAAFLWAVEDDQLCDLEEKSQMIFDNKGKDAP